MKPRMAGLPMALGDQTAYMLGRVTFNPVKHVDPFGTLIMPGLMLLLSGGKMMFGYAKPVPVNTRNFARIRRDMALVAVAGPGINIILAVLSALGFYLHWLSYQKRLHYGWRTTLQIPLESM